MVNTRSQVFREKRIDQSEDDRLSDNDDNVSVADQNREIYFGENDEQTMRSMEMERNSRSPKDAMDPECISEKINNNSNKHFKY